MLERFLESYYRLRPVNATFTGRHEHDRRLPDWSPEGLERAAGEMRALRAELAPQADDEIEWPDGADLALADAFLEIQIAELDGGHFQRGNPALATGEAMFGALSLTTREFAPAADRLEPLVARLAAIPGFLAGARASLAPSAPPAWTERALRECQAATIAFGRGLDCWLDDARIDDDGRQRSRRAADEALAAFEAFARAQQQETRDAPARRYACGGDFFDLLLSRGHWCRRTRADLLADLRAALDEALARVHELADAAAPGGWPAVQARLAARHPSAEGYLSAFQRRWRACRALAEDQRLVTWPDSPVRYVPIPRHARDAAPLLSYLFYRSPAPFDRLAIHDYLVTPIDDTLAIDEQERRLAANNEAVIKLNHVVHHGGIGHHVQNDCARRSASEIGRIAAVDCANRIGLFSGGSMAEGWACYATDLMEEVGFLTDLERVAQRHTRARLLARAVVDIELHQGSMDFDAAAALYRDRIGMTADAARAEATKNSMFPGTAIMYWLGTDAIHRLRRERERLEGAGFSLQRFHDRLLAYGSIPVELIATLFRRDYPA